MARRKMAEAAVSGQAAKPTREMLLDTAGKLLEEVGIERISTNLICSKAGVTPPTLYHYFASKYAVLEALGKRLMDRQNDVLAAWIARCAPHGLPAFLANLETLLRDTVEVTDAEPGGLWILRALHATPRLAHVRIESHDHVTGLLVEAVGPLFPELTRKQVTWRIRMIVEFGYAASEMAAAAGAEDRAIILAETARVQRLSLLDT